MTEPATWPKLRQDLVVSQQQSDGTTYYVLKDPITFRYFRLREPEYFIIRQFDGATDYDTIAARLQDQFGLTVPPDAVRQFADKLDSLFFLDGTRAEYEISSGRYRGRTSPSLLSRLLFIKLKAFNPRKLLATLLPPLRFLFRPWSVTVMILFVLAGFWIYSANLSYLRFNAADLFTLSSILTIIISLALIIVVHEFAHALTCTYHGGQVREMGFLLLYFQPCFYANLSDSWMFPRKSARLAVIWAGLFFQMVLFAAAVFGWRVTVIGTTVNQLFWLTANVCLLTLLFNLNPLIKLDGYYLLSEMINIPNLRRRSFGYLASVITRSIGVVDDLPDISPRERRLSWTYVVLAGLFSAFLIGYMIVAVYHFLVSGLGAVGFVLFLILLILIFKTPLARTGRFITDREVVRALFTKPRNLILGPLIIIALVLLLFIVPFPRSVGGDIIVRPLAEYAITLVSEQGRLESSLREGGRSRRYHTEQIQLSTGDLAVLKLTPLVAEGDTVRRGDTLAAITSTQVSTGLTGARSELERLHGELALAQSPPKPEAVAAAQAEVNAAQTDMEQRKKDIDRYQSLYEKKLISKQQLEQYQSDFDIAQSHLKEAKSRLKLLESPPKKEEVAILRSRIATQEANLSYLASQQAAQVIVCPIDGEVVAVYRNDLLIKVAAMNMVEVAIPITDNYLEFVQPDADVRVKVRTFSDQLFRGTVVHIARSAAEAHFPDSRARFDVFAVLSNKDRLLRDGMSGYAKVSCGSASLVALAAERIKSFLRVEFWSWW